MSKTFETTDSVWSRHSGEAVVATAPMPEDRYDKAEVGPMFYATLESGVTVEAFEDEIKEAQA